MTPNLLARLTRLETIQIAPIALEISFSPALRLLRLLLAVHLGGLRPSENVAEGEARALGYGSPAEMQSAMVANRTAFIGWGTAHNVATEKLLASRGGGSAAGGRANREALHALLAALPEALADHPDADPDQIHEATQWVSL